MSSTNFCTFNFAQNLEDDTYNESKRQRSKLLVVKKVGYRCSAHLLWTWWSI